MFHIPLPWTDNVLLLNPRWGEWQGAVQISAMVLVVLVPAVLVVWLYRYELRLIRRSLALGLLTLRLVVILFLWLVALWQPILARSTTEELPGRALVAVDRSASMDVADPQRDPVEKLRLAKALHLGQDVVAEAQLDDWIRQYESSGKVEWVGDQELAKEPDRRRQLAQERKRLHDEVSRRVDALTRTQTARAVLAADGLGLLDAITGKHRVDLMGFGRDGWEVKSGRLDDLFQAPVEDNESEPARDTRSLLDGTDLRLPLVRALEHSGPREEKMLGVVILSDGRHNWGPSPVAKAIELGQQQIPIYPVALGAIKAPPDVALVGIKAPPAVFKGVEAQVEARIKVSGLPKQDIPVVLEQPGQSPMTEHIAHDGTDRYHSVRFTVRLDQVGAQTLTVTARPVPGETRTDNNSRPVVINVADDKARVLLVDGEARWEYHYLASALHRDPTMQLRTVVFDQPRLGKIPEDELHQAGNPTLALPAEADALAGYDCVIVGDVGPAHLPLPDRIRLEKYVADRGGTLVLLAGKRFLPMAYTEPPGDGTRMPAGADDPLLKLLPIQESRVARPVQGFPVTLTHAGRLTSFLQMDAAPDKSLDLWARLPPQFWGVIGKAKPGATSLVYLPEDGSGNKPDVGTQEKDRALIVRQNYGFGRVLFIGLDSTWRWRYKVGDVYHHRFWSQVIRWAAADKPLVAGNEQVRFGTREPVYQQGQDVDLVVRLGEEVKPLGASAVAAARILRRADGKEQPAALVPLTRREAQPRVMEGRLRDLPPGQYFIELAIPALADQLRGPTGKLRAEFAVTPSASEETLELAANRPLLEELAIKSGGRVFTPENVNELADLLIGQAITHQLHIENPLWQWWPTLALFLVFLTLEWMGRKWAGLP
jgi:hypothetical protein